MRPTLKVICIEGVSTTTDPNALVKGCIYNVCTGKDIYHTKTETSSDMYYIINDDGQVCSVYHEKFFEVLSTWRDHCIDTILEEQE